MTFDMNQCKPGDKLLCRDGSIATYHSKNTDFRKRHMEEYPHNIHSDEYFEAKWSVTDSGRMFGDIQCRLDIVDSYESDEDSVEE